MTGSVEKIGRTDGNARACGFDRRERGVIIHRAVCQQYFLAATPSHVQGGKVIQRSRRACTCEKPSVRSIPEAVLAGPFPGD